VPQEASQDTYYYFLKIIKSIIESLKGSPTP